VRWAFKMMIGQRKYMNSDRPTLKRAQVNNFVKWDCGWCRGGSACKFRGGAISVIFGNQVSLLVHYSKRDEVSSQHFCDKTMDEKMALYCECCFPNVQNHGEKSSYVLGGRSPSPGSALGWWHKYMKQASSPFPI